MGEGVVADYVAGACRVAHDVRALCRVAANDKKGGANIVFCQDFEKAERVWVVGAVVVGEGDFFFAARKTGEGAAVPLSGGRHRLIAQRACGRAASRRTDQ